MQERHACLSKSKELPFLVSGRLALVISLSRSRKGRAELRWVRQLCERLSEDQASGSAASE